MCIYSFLDTLTISGDTSGGEGRGKKSVLAIELPRSNLSSLHRRRLDRRPTKETRREQARSRNHTLAAFLLDLATNQDVDVYNFFFFQPRRVPRRGGSVHEVPHEYRNNVGGAGRIDRREKLCWSGRFTFAPNDLGGIKFYESSRYRCNNLSLEPFPTDELS